jgi:hypothetical protein
MKVITDKDVLEKVVDYAATKRALERSQVEVDNSRSPVGALVHFTFVAGALSVVAQNLSATETAAVAVVGTAFSYGVSALTTAYRKRQTQKAAHSLSDLLKERGLDSSETSVLLRDLMGDAARGHEAGADGSTNRVEDRVEDELDAEPSRKRSARLN